MFIEYFYKPKFDQYHGSARNSWCNISTTIGLTNIMALLEILGEIFLLPYDWQISWLCWKFCVKYFYYHRIDFTTLLKIVYRIFLQTYIWPISWLCRKFLVKYFYYRRIDQYHGSAGNSAWNISTTVGFTNFMALLKTFGEIFQLLLIWPSSWLLRIFLVKYFFYCSIDQFHSSAENSYEIFLFL